MRWESIQDLSGNAYEVNWDGVYRIIRSYAHSVAIYRNTRVLRETHWIGPDLVTVNVDWAKVRHQTDGRSDELLEQFYRDSLRSMPTQITMLRQMMEETSWYNGEFAQTQRDASRETMANIGKSVDRLETGQKGAEIVRDLSAETLLIGATMLSGGAALAVLGGGSALKGTAKWQDTGKWEAGVFTASTELLFGALRFKVRAGVDAKTVTKGTEAILTLVALPKAKAGMEFVSKSVVEGKSVGESAISGLLKGTDPAILALAKELARPAQGTKGQFFWNGVALLAAGAIKLSRDKGVAAVAVMANGAAKSPGKPQTSSLPAKQKHIVDSAVFGQDLLEQMAVRPLFSR